MENFLAKVIKATKELGNGPYDYRKTEKKLLEATRKTLDHYYKLKEEELDGYPFAEKNKR